MTPELFKIYVDVALYAIISIILVALIIFIAIKIYNFMQQEDPFHS